MTASARRTKVPNASDRDDVIVLRDGPVVPIAALLLALELETRGIRLSREGDSLLVRPKGQLTAEEREQIRRWKPYLLALAAYEAPGIQ